jgi:hypothetical protein
MVFRGRLILFVAALGLAATALGSSGCIVILPPIPQSVWGYGQGYEFVDERGAPVNSGGWLLMRSPYTYDDKNELIRCFPILRTGYAEVPKTALPRFESGPLGLMCEEWEIELPLGFYAMWCNPLWTEVYPLLPGYVPTGWPEHAGPIFIDESRPPPRVIHLMRTSRRMERQYLEEYTRSMGTEMGENKSAIEQAQQYAHHRLQELGGEPQKPDPEEKLPDTEEIEDERD